MKASEIHQLSLAQFCKKAPILPIKELGSVYALDLANCPLQPSEVKSRLNNLFSDLYHATTGAGKGISLPEFIKIAIDKVLKVSFTGDLNKIDIQTGQTLFVYKTASVFPLPTLLAEVHIKCIKKALDAGLEVDLESMKESHPMVDFATGLSLGDDAFGTLRGGESEASLFEREEAAKRTFQRGDLLGDIAKSTERPGDTTSLAAFDLFDGSQGQGIGLSEFKTHSIQGLGRGGDAPKEAEGLQETEKILSRWHGLDPRGAASEASTPATSELPASAMAMLEKTGEVLGMRSNLDLAANEAEENTFLQKKARLQVQTPRQASPTPENLLPEPDAFAGLPPLGGGSRSAEQAQSVTEDQRATPAASVLPAVETGGFDFADFGSAVSPASDIETPSGGGAAAPQALNVPPVDTVVSPSGPVPVAEHTEWFSSTETPAVPTPAAVNPPPIQVKPTRQAEQFDFTSDLDHQPDSPARVSGWNADLMEMNEKFLPPKVDNNEKH